jgi:RNA polymerase primary sigma factor
MMESRVRVNQDAVLVEPTTTSTKGGTEGPAALEAAQARRSVRQLMERAEQQGYLTVDDLLELLPESEGDLPEVEKLMTWLAENAVEIIVPDDAEAQVTSTVIYRSEAESVQPADLSGIDSHDSVGLYFKEIGGVPLLTREQEVRLAKRIEAGQVAQRRLQRNGLKPQLRERYLRQVETARQARSSFIRANTRLVISIAKRYRSPGVPFLDLIQEGNLGLLKAVARFDYRRGCKFSTYATWWIRQSIRRALGEQSRVIRLPSYIGDHIRKVFRAAQDIEQETGKQPTAQQIASQLGVTSARVRWLMRISRRTLSLQTPVGEEKDSDLGEFIEDEDSPAPYELAEARLLLDRMEQALSTLTPRQERILRLRYGLEGGHSHTLKEVAAKFGLTRERIRQIERKALRRLRHPSRSRQLRAFMR